MKSSVIVSLVFLASLLLSSCGGNNFRTDFPSPTGDEKFSEIYPEEIGGAPLTFEQLELDPERYRGAMGRYGSSASIMILQTSDVDALDSYVKEVEVPKLESYSNRTSGKTNGVWSFRAKGAQGRTQGWQTGQWLFVIRTDTDELFDEIVEEFPYIAKK